MRDEGDSKGTLAAAWPFAAAPEAELETLRLRHIRAESRLRVLGTYSIISGVVLLIFSIADAVGTSDLFAHGFLGGLAVLESAGYVITGWWLRRLRLRGRTWMTVVLVGGSVLRVIEAFTAWMRDEPIALLVAVFAFSVLFIAIYAWILWNRLARTVLTRHYLEIVIPATPQVKRRTKLLWFLLGLTFVMFVVMGITIAMNDPELLQEDSVENAEGRDP
jgi:hypothetical protein